MKPRLGTVLAAIYLLAAGCALFLILVFGSPDDSGRLVAYGMLVIWILTLPWSVVFIAATWWLIEDPQNPAFLLYFGSCAGLNAYLIARIARLASTRSEYS
jgi:hypothetical protein